MPNWRNYLKTKTMSNLLTKTFILPYIFRQSLSFSRVNQYIKFIMYSISLTHSMVQSRSWEANWFAASQEIPRISRNPKVHYRTHKRPPPVSILGQPNPVHKPTSHLLEIRPNIIHPSTPRSPQWSLYYVLYIYISNKTFYSMLTLQFFFFDVTFLKATDEAAYRVKWALSLFSWHPYRVLWLPNSTRRLRIFVLKHNSALFCYVANTHVHVCTK